MSSEPGLLLVGIGIGTFISAIPMPVQIVGIQPYLGVIFVLVGVILMLKMGGGK